MRRLSLAIALLIPLALDGALLAEVVPEILFTERKEELGLEDRDRLTEEALKAEESGEYKKAFDLWDKVIKISRKELGPDHVETLEAIFHLLSLLIDDENNNNIREGGYPYLKYYGAELTKVLEVMTSPEKTLNPTNLAKSFAESVGGTSIEKADQIISFANYYWNVDLNHEKSVALYIKALELVEEDLGDNHPKIATILIKIAELYQIQGLSNQAKPLFSRAKKIKTYNLVSKDPRTLEYLFELALSYKEAALYNESESLLLHVLKIKEEVFSLNSPEIIVNLLELAEFYWVIGYPSKAEIFAKRALEINKKHYGANNIERIHLLELISQVYLSLGAIEKSQFFASQMLDLCNEVLDPLDPRRNVALINMASVYIKQGLYSKAEEYTLLAIDNSNKVWIERDSIPNPYKQELAEIYILQGKYKEAENLYETILPAQRKILQKDHPRIAKTYMKLGDLNAEQGSYTKAEKYYLQCLAIIEKVFGDRNSRISSISGRLAAIYIATDQEKKAHQWWERGLKVTLKEIQINSSYLPIKKRSNYLKSVQNLPHAWIFSEAAYSSGEEIAMFLRLNYQGLLADIEKRQSLLSSITGSNQGIIQELTRITSQLAYIHINNEQERDLRSKQEDLERTLYQLLPEIKPNIVTVSEISKVLPRDSVLVEFQRYHPYKPEWKFIGIGIRYSIDEKTGNYVVDKVFKSSPAFNSGLKPQDIIISINGKELKGIDLHEVSNLLSGEKGLGIEIKIKRARQFIEVPLNLDVIRSQEKYFNPRYMALTLNPNGKINSIDLGSAKRIDNMIKDALKASESPPEFATDLKNAQDLWKEVGDLVVKPLKEAVGEAKTVFISPDAELNRIPFAALGSPNGDKLLGEDFNLRLLSTGRELLDLAKESKSSKQKSLVVANPAFNLIKNFPRKQSSDLIVSSSSQQRSSDLSSINWSPLPGTVKEGETIAKITKAQLLTQNKATALAVQEQGAPKVLHIASHAYFLDDQNKGENPLIRSGIVLAGANEPDANPKDDGYLTALEVSKLDWQGTELAVISGCESGKGDIQYGEGVYGLKRAIAVAGARSSLLSLWKVDDRATAAFMKSFYQRLKKGEGRADALAATQKEFRNHPYNAMYRHPYVWAAFQLSGDWRPIQW